MARNSHVNNICAHANRVLGLIRKSFGIKNKEGIEIAFKALVLPIMEYGCQVWNPELRRHITTVESVQRRANRLIC